MKKRTGGVYKNLNKYIYVSMTPFYVIQLTPTNEMGIEKSMVGEKRNYCSYFGCGKELNLQESLAGTLCLNHQGNIRKIY